MLLMNSSATERQLGFSLGNEFESVNERGGGSLRRPTHILELTSVETRDSGFFAGKPKGLEIKLEANG